jgi:hypothetical protein
MQPADGDVDRSAAEVSVRRGIRPGLTFLVACALAFIAVLLIFAGVLPSVSGIFAVALVLTALFWLIRAQLSFILLVFVAVLLASVVATQRLPKLRPDRMQADEGTQLARKWKGSGRFDEKLPIVVHLVFDEMMSTGAMTDDLPGASQTRQSLLDFGEKHSFRTFDSVYSRYFYTSEAIPEMMNREYLGRTGMDSFSPLPFNAKTKSYAAKSNVYFEDMAARGYRTVVFQSSYLNLCANEHVDMCQTLDSFDPAGKDVSGVDGPTQRVNLWQTVLRAYEPSYTSEIGQRIVGRAYGLEGEVGVVGDAGRYDVRRFPQWFDRFTTFVGAVPRGTHVFAHFLVPHDPYLLLESCVVSGKVDSGHYLSQYPSSEHAARRQDYYARYLTQMRCVALKLDNFMSAVNQSENFRDAVIIIHGDHGSRISIGDVVDDYSKRDFIDNYGTYFAVRSPGVPAGVDCEFVSLPEVFRRYVARPGEIVPRMGPLPVVVLGRHAGTVKKVEARMPLFGCAAGPAAPGP